MSFEAENQLLYFIICLSFGYIFGIISAIFDVLCEINNTILNCICVILRYILFAFCFVLCKNIYNLPNIRLYMPLCALCGFTLYKKTLYKIIAIYAKKLYNKAIKLLKRRKIKNVTRQKNKIGSRRNVGNGSFIVYSYSGNDLSDDCHQRKKNKKGRARPRNKTFGARK